MCVCDGEEEKFSHLKENFLCFMFDLLPISFYFSESRCHADVTNFISRCQLIDLKIKSCDIFTMLCSLTLTTVICLRGVSSKISEKRKREGAMCGA